MWGEEGCSVGALDESESADTQPADKLAFLFSSVNRQVFCVGDRFKHEAWNNNSVVAHKSVGSMTTKGQMRPTFRVS